MKMQTSKNATINGSRRLAKRMSLNCDVSVIIPIFNVEQFVADCLDSVTSQTHDEIEIILVDDGSTDNSGKIADAYAMKDKRIRVVHKKNGGLSDARNAGLKIAKGDYIMFVDSDDYVDKEFVAIALQNIKVHGADIVCFRFTYVAAGVETKISSTNTNQDYKWYSNIAAIKDSFSLGGALKVNAWNKIYKRDLFIENNITYPVGRLHEDNLTTYKLMYFANKVVYINKTLLFYRQRPGSIMKDKLNIQGVRMRIGMLNETVGWLDDRVTRRDLHEIYKSYAKTLLVVLVGEAISKRQPFIIPAILFELVKKQKGGLK